MTLQALGCARQVLKLVFHSLAHSKVDVVLSSGQPYSTSKEYGAVEFA